MKIGISYLSSVSKSSLKKRGFLFNILVDFSSAKLILNLVMISDISLLNFYLFFVIIIAISKKNG